MVELVAIAMGYRGVLTAVAGARLCLLEEGTYVHSTTLFWEIDNRLR